MKIGYFTSIEGWGGSETFLRDLMLGARAVGHEVVLIGVEGSRLVDELRASGVKCVLWRSINPDRTEQVAGGHVQKKNRIWRKAPVGMRLLVGNLRESWRLAKLIRTLNLDVLHVNVNGYEIAGLAGFLASVPSIGCYLIVAPPEPSLIRRLFRWVTLLTYKHIVFQSVVGRDSVINRRKGSDKSCSIIPNGIDVSGRIARPFEAQSPKEGCRLLSMARLHAMKGHEDVIRAIALMRDRSVSLDILGEGPEEQSLKMLIHTLGLEGRVRLLGHIDSFEDNLCGADAFVMASVSHESCPASLLLAMAASLPVVTSDLPALTEINESGVTGIVAKMGDPVDIAACMQKLVDYPETGRRMGIAGRERIIKHFSKAGMIVRWIDVYLRTVAQCGISGRTHL